MGHRLTNLTHRRRQTQASLTVGIMASLAIHGLILLCWNSLGADKNTPKAMTGRQPATVVPLLSQKRVQRLTANRAARQSMAKKRKKEQEKLKLEREAVQKRAQIVEINPPKNQTPPKEAQFVSEYDSSVKKQQVSSNKRSPSQKMVKSDRRLISPGKDLNGSRSGRPKKSEQAKTQTAEARRKRRRQKRPQTKNANNRSRASANGRSQNPSRGMETESAPLSPVERVLERVVTVGLRVPVSPKVGVHYCHRSARKTQWPATVLSTM